MNLQGKRNRDAMEEDRSSVSRPRLNPVGGALLDAGVLPGLPARVLKNSSAHASESGCSNLFSEMFIAENRDGQSLQQPREPLSRDLSKRLSSSRDASAASSLRHLSIGPGAVPTTFAEAASASPLRRFGSGFTPAPKARWASSFDGISPRGVGDVSPTPPPMVRELQAVPETTLWRGGGPHDNHRSAPFRQRGVDSSSDEGGSDEESDDDGNVEEDHRQCTGGSSAPIASADAKQQRQVDDGEEDEEVTVIGVRRPSNASSSGAPSCVGRGWAEESAARRHFERRRRNEEYRGPVPEPRRGSTARRGRRGVTFSDESQSPGRGGQRDRVGLPSSHRHRHSRKSNPSTLAQVLRFLGSCASFLTLVSFLLEIAKAGEARDAAAGGNTDGPWGSLVKAMSQVCALSARCTLIILRGLNP